MQAPPLPCLEEVSLSKAVENEQYRILEAHVFRQSMPARIAAFRQSCMHNSGISHMRVAVNIDAGVCAKMGVKGSQKKCQESRPGTTAHA